MIKFYTYTTFCMIHLRCLRMDWGVSCDTVIRKNIQYLFDLENISTDKKDTASVLPSLHFLRHLTHKIS